MQVTARKNKYRQTFTSTVIQQCKSEALPKADNTITDTLLQHKGNAVMIPPGTTAAPDVDQTVKDHQMMVLFSCH